MKAAPPNPFARLAVIVFALALGALSETGGSSWPLLAMLCLLLSASLWRQALDPRGGSR